MATESDLRDLRLRAASILKSQACMNIRFELENVRIQTYMYAYIGSAIVADNVHLDIGSSNFTRTDNNTITFASADVDAPTIVHESTHALIDATHVGQTVTTGVHEATAYLAETVYALNANYSNHKIDVPHLMGPLYNLARQIREFNAAHKSGLFVCSKSDTTGIISIMSNSGLRQNMNHTEVMDGINEAPHRGLIGHMFTESKRK